MISNYALEEGLNELRPGERLHSVLVWGDCMMAIFETALQDPIVMQAGGGAVRAAKALAEAATRPGKSPEAVALGARGGRARAKNLTTDQMSVIAKMGGRPRSKK